MTQSEHPGAGTRARVVSYKKEARYPFTRLYFEGASRVWLEASEQQRSHDAIGRLYRLYQKQHQQPNGQEPGFYEVQDEQQNRLEAALQRHWPELSGYLGPDSVTLEDLLLSFGSPAELSAGRRGP